MVVGGRARPPNRVKSHTSPHGDWTFPFGFRLGAGSTQRVKVSIRVRSGIRARVRVRVVITVKSRAMVATGLLLALRAPFG